MAQPRYRIRSLVTLCLALVISSHADKSTGTTSRATPPTSIATGLDFTVPEPVQAPGVNTSSGCGKELASDLQPGGDTAGPFNFETADGYGRNYTIHIPRYYDPNKASPLIFGLPGQQSTYKDIENQTDLSSESMNPYAVTIYISGVMLGFESNPGYGDTEGAIYPEVDDIGFMNDFIDDLTDRFCIDTGRIWAVGHSNGGGFTNVMACDPVLSTRITAFAANSGAFYTNDTKGDPDTVATDTTVQDQCSPGHKPIPYIEFHGTEDTVIDYEGATNHSSNGIRVLPDIQHWASEWAVRNGYSTDNITSRPYDNVTVYQWGGPDNLGVVTHYRLRGWVHDYARKSAGAPLDATPIIMRFFYSQTNFTTGVTATTTTTGVTPISSGAPTGGNAASPTPTADAGEASTVAGPSILAIAAALVLFSLVKH